MAKTFQEILAQAKNAKTGHLNYDEAMSKVADLLDQALNTKLQLDGPKFDGSLTISETKKHRCSTGEDFTSWSVNNDAEEILVFTKYDSGKCFVTYKGFDYQLNSSDANNIDEIISYLIEDTPCIDATNKPKNFASFVDELANSATDPEVKGILQNILGQPATVEFEAQLSKALFHVITHLDEYKFGWNANIFQIYKKEDGQPYITLSIDPDNHVSACFGTVTPTNSNMRLGEEGDHATRLLMDKIKKTKSNSLSEMHPLLAALDNALEKGENPISFLKSALS